jgi:hypothetical protein
MAGERRRRYPFEELSMRLLHLVPTFNRRRAPRNKYQLALSDCMILQGKARDLFVVWYWCRGSSGGLSTGTVSVRELSDCILASKGISLLKSRSAYLQPTVHNGNWANTSERSFCAIAGLHKSMRDANTPKTKFIVWWRWKERHCRDMHLI